MNGISDCSRYIFVRVNVPSVCYLKKVSINMQNLVVSEVSGDPYRDGTVEIAELKFM